ncbi:MAG: hypothetical protein OK439_00110 [Thaumarchaeota archaeon]|nr:hypothetical protein [Nitrososphaerota archaeon]
MVLTELRSVEPFRKGQPDNVFVCCANSEERCLGAVNRFSNYNFSNAFVFYYDEIELEAISNLKLLESRLSLLGPTRTIRTAEDDPRDGIAELYMALKSLLPDPTGNIITIDVSAFSKRHILLLLKNLDKLGFWGSLRIVYSEPERYSSNLYLPMSVGIKRIDVVPGFVNLQSLGKPLLLIIMLGYEGDRATALVHNIDPNETLLAIPRPAYRKEWEGRTEEMNKNLIKLIGRENVIGLHSLDSDEVAISLRELLVSGKINMLSEKNCCIVPLGTKPQTVGLYYFWREHQGQFEIQYASPFHVNEEFFSSGVGKTWLLHQPSNPE